MAFNYPSYQNPYLMNYAQGYQIPQAAPAMPQVPQAQQSGTQGGFSWVQGEAGAKAHVTRPGGTDLLMDSEDTLFYLKTADASGIPMPLRKFRYEEIQEVVPAAPAGDYVTRAEFNELREIVAGKAAKADE